MSRRLTGYLAALLVVILIAGAALGWRELHLPGTFPIKVVKVQGQYQYVSADALKLTLMPYVKSGFFNVNIRSAQNALLNIPGVQSASIRRVFPDTVQISIIEQQAIARWDGVGLISSTGVIFTPRLIDLSRFNDLPLFSAETSDIPEILKMYTAVTALLQAVGLKLDALSVDPTGDWQLKTEQGFEIELGSVDMLSRLQAFLQGYKALMESQPGNGLVYVDLRYRKGFAVQWQEPMLAPSKNAQNAAKNS